MRGPPSRAQAAESGAGLASAVWRDKNCQNSPLKTLFFPQTQTVRIKNSDSGVWLLLDTHFGLSPGAEITFGPTCIVLRSHLVNEILITFPTSKLRFPECI